MKNLKWLAVTAGTMSVVAGGLLAAAALRADPPATVPVAKAKAATEPDAREADRAAIAQAAKDFAQAFSKGDAKGIVAAWTENGEYYDDLGTALRGRPAIEAAYTELFQQAHQPRLEVEIQSIRFPSRDTAIEEGVLRLSNAGPDLPTSTRYSVLHVREDGEWKAAISRETGAALDKLDDLNWLIGAWTNGEKQREVSMRFEWNELKTLIHQRFTVRDGGLAVASGMQTISRDPLTGRLRTLSITDDGGRGESIWHRDGNRWVLDSVGRQADGGETTATDLITRLGDNEFVWRSTQRTLDGEDLADTQPVKLTRVKPAE